MVIIMFHFRQIHEISCPRKLVKPTHYILFILQVELYSAARQDETYQVRLEIGKQTHKSFR